MIIVGLSPLVHESAVGLLVDGKLVAAASEERFTRVKNQGGFPHQALEFVLRSAGVKPSEVDAVAYAGFPFFHERRLDIEAYGRNLAYVGRVKDRPLLKLRHIANYTRNMLTNRGWQTMGGTERAMRAALNAHGIPEEKLVFIDHHKAHCASAYYASGFDRCLAVSLDGYGSGQSGSFYLAEGGQLKRLASIPYPHSLGTFYRRITQALGFRPNRHEGKVVGLAAYGDASRLREQVLARFDLTGDDYFRYKTSQDPFFEKRLAAKFAAEDLAATYQDVLERVATKYIQAWLRRTGTRHVAAAGGVFANVKMNQRVVELPEVDRLFVFPNMGDGGVGTGAAFALQADLAGLEPTQLANAYLGPEFSEQEMEAALVSANVPYARPNDTERAIVEHLEQDRVVARFNGRMEFGPRALGNRSILYPAAEPEVNQWLNERLRRTEFMPFAPVSLDEAAHDLYDSVDSFRHAGQFMTVTTNCTDRMRKASPAAVHVDGTARPQLVKESTNPSLHRVLTQYRDKTGIPTLINTSFNMHEEPIVCTPADAVRAFQDSKLEVLALGPFVAEAPEAPSASDKPRASNKSGARA